MKITKNSDHVLFENNKGSYHLSHQDFERMGQDAATKLAENEIETKQDLSFDKKEIDFKGARALGFCEYGIRDFCEKLNLDINKRYLISELKGLLTAEAILEYPDEILKIFGASCLDNFGGAYAFLEKIKTSEALSFVLREEFIPKKELELLACDFAESVLHIFEKQYPEDDRPRRAIEAERLFIAGGITESEWAAAWAAAWSAAWSAARDAARDAAWDAAWAAAWAAARSAARDAAWAAAWSAARDAAGDADWDAAWAAELKLQIKKTLSTLKQTNKG